MFNSIVSSLNSAFSMYAKYTPYWLLFQLANEIRSPVFFSPVPSIEEKVLYFIALLCWPIFVSMDLSNFIKGTKQSGLLDDCILFFSLCYLSNNYQILYTYWL